MTEPIDVDAFVAQLADDELISRELTDLAEAKPAPRTTTASLLDRLVARATVVALEFQLRGLSLVSNGDEFEEALYATFEELKLELPEQAAKPCAIDLIEKHLHLYAPQPGDDELLREIERRLWDQ
ncbi:hypothetical protein [Amycolatopsis vancoresmycina]|uniref:Uncharacterized protein n=1 Tax=Amycolatopsis vancoresmycina DSM 44592 TaxID=1292037 RepID=R1IIW2_9PSEU|nr:hypothetical protein [Amycolatopsis vancoresmycina]EOD70354.1 hypothetical protein H480_01522 [Amycolatopsis vancoresmycina DSM 44592]